MPDVYCLQSGSDACTAAVKSGDLAGGSRYFKPVQRNLAYKGVNAAVHGCTELPFAVLGCDPGFYKEMTLDDSTLEQARASVRYGIDRGSNIPAKKLV